jgi:hypothetical protein
LRVFIGVLNTLVGKEGKGRRQVGHVWGWDIEILPESVVDW